MPRLRLADVGLPYKKIMQGSKWIGRVYKNAQGTYTGQIGKAPNRIEATATTERKAFAEIAARHFGMENAEALRQHNREVRSVRRQRRAASGDILSQLERVLGQHVRPAPRVDLGLPSEPERGEDDFQPPREQRRAILGNDFMPSGRRRRH
jgi:hypothetical protein